MIWIIQIYTIEWKFNRGGLLKWMMKNVKLIWWREPYDYMNTDVLTHYGGLKEILTSSAEGR
jgi:hypothetical protein